jgi:hypothetical protein
LGTLIGGAVGGYPGKNLWNKKNVLDPFIHHLILC